MKSVSCLVEDEREERVTCVFNGKTYFLLPSPRNGINIAKARNFDYVRENYARLVIKCNARGNRKLDNEIC